MSKQVIILFGILAAITILSVDVYAADFSGSDITGIETIVNDIETPFLNQPDIR